MNRHYCFRDLAATVAAIVAVLSVCSTSLFASSAVQVPEPVSISLLGIGVAGLVGSKWMKSRRKK